MKRGGDIPGDGHSVNNMKLIDKILKLAAQKFIVDETVDDETALQRMSVCLQCDKRDPVEQRCKVCGCYLEPKTGAKTNWNVKKTRHEITHCPLGKWDDLETANEYRKLDGKPLLTTT